MELYLAAFRKVMAEVDQLPDPDQDADDKWHAMRARIDGWRTAPGGSHTV
jgi:hypothetical protein